MGRYNSTSYDDRICHNPTSRCLVVRHLLDASGLPSGNVGYSKCTISTEDWPSIEYLYSSYLLDAKLTCPTLSGPSSLLAPTPPATSVPSAETYSAQTRARQATCQFLLQALQGSPLGSVVGMTLASSTVRIRVPSLAFKPSCEDIDPAPVPNVILQPNHRTIALMVITGKGGQGLTKRLEYRSVKKRWVASNQGCQGYSTALERIIKKWPAQTVVEFL